MGVLHGLEIAESYLRGFGQKDLNHVPFTPGLVSMSR
jgi:hypothetical protein